MQPEPGVAGLHRGGISAVHHTDFTDFSRRRQIIGQRQLLRGEAELDPLLVWFVRLLGPKLAHMGAIVLFGWLVDRSWRRLSEQRPEGVLPYVLLFGCGIVELVLILGLALSNESV